MDEINRAIIELTEKIDWLEKLYNQTLSNINNNINQFWIVFFGLLGLIGIGLVYLAKQMTKSGIEKGVEKIRQEYDSKLLKFDEKFAEIDLIIDKIPTDFITESGTWTPEISPDVYKYLNNTGKYYRIGNVVIVWFDIEISDNNVNKSMVKYIGPVVIKGLPFIADSDSACDIITRTKDDGIGKQYKGYIRPMYNFILISKVTEDRSIEDLIHIVDKDIDKDRFEVGTQIKGTLIYKI